MALLMSSLLERGKFIRLVRVNRVLSVRMRSSLKGACVWGEVGVVIYDDWDHGATKESINP